MDDSAWGNGLTGNYVEGENSWLISPKYKALQGGPAIVFQHCYKTEANHDGGNFDYSTDGGSSWISLTPCAGRGYDGDVSALGEDGWFGNSSGWYQSVFKLTSVVKDGTFRVRWHFAADGDNTTDRGWLIDEVAGIGCTDPSMGGKNPGGRGSVIDTMAVWPNPVGRSGQISYTLLKDCDVSINLYDASGRLAKRIASTRSRRGLNTAKIDVSKLARGVYFVKLEGDGDSKTTKVVIE